ncbi:MAG: aspartate/glutamate racemase family protein [Candidatus Heimdallarchaeaceae archaeon]
MKKIGIIGGMSAESTIEYYRILVHEYNKIKGGLSSPSIVIDSLNLEEIKSYMENNQWDEVFKAILNSAKALEAAGAKIIVIATNTIHKIYDKLASSIETEIISIMDATAEKIKAAGITKVGLLGTKFTMQEDFYPKALARYGIEVLVPLEEEQEIINRIIWQELTHHVITEESRKSYMAIIQNLASRGAGGVILGCTEIPLLIQQKHSSIPVFDTTKIHALAALKEAMK